VKSKTIVLTEFNKPLETREVEIPPLTDGSVLIRIGAAGVCGSDVHMWKGEDPRTPLPIVLGHEGVGTVVDVSGNRQTVEGEKFKEGDTILWNRGVSCGRCFFCKVLNEPSLCADRKVYGINRSFDTAPHLNGCYSEYIILDERTDIFKIGDKVDPAILVSASCSGATVAHGFDMAAVHAGDTVVVQGPGPLGVFAVAFAKKYGAAQIIVIGGSEARLKMCSDFGATMVINRKKTSIEERREIIMGLTGSRGADLVVEAVGSQGVVEEGLKLLRLGGMYLSTGFAQPAGEESVDFFLDVVRKNIRIQGVWVSDTRHTYHSINLVMDNQELFGKMITHRFSLDEANEAISVMNNRAALKAVLIP
jgi:threonine dehydrogenase-like Zn-dependent dehydrogenase